MSNDTNGVQRIMYPVTGERLTIKFVSPVQPTDAFPAFMAREIAGILESDNFDGVFTHYIESLRVYADALSGYYVVT